MIKKMIELDFQSLFLNLLKFLDRIYQEKNLKMQQRVFFLNEQIKRKIKFKK